MKKISSIIVLASLLLSCNHAETFERRAEEFLESIPSEYVIASFTDANRHCIFYIEEEDLGFTVEAGDKCHNIIKYDLKTQKSAKVLRSDSKSLNPSLEKGAGFITIDYFDTNNTSIFISSYIDSGYYDLAIYNINDDRWYYLGSFPVEKIQMTDTEIRCSSEDFPFIYKDCFGPLTWIKEFDMNGNCTENYVYDELCRKNYDAQKFVEEEDVAYMDNLLRENFIAYLERETISDTALLNELKSNQIACDAKYKGESFFFHIGSVRRIYSGDRYAYHVTSCPDWPYELHCFSNDSNIEAWSSGQSYILWGKYENSDSYCIYMTDCRTADSDLLDQVFHAQYLQYIANQKR